MCKTTEQYIRFIYTSVTKYEIKEIKENIVWDKRWPINNIELSK